ncbi:AraC family transcriptional regulator [Clostridium perfringens]|nr:AraC family transcriptional regulator [Clostridium perfringens]
MKKSIANKVIKIIKNEYSSELSLDYIADKVNFTPTYLSYVFKKETGSNIVKYITDFRMNKAKEFLEEGNMKIVQVGKACGYENQSYFNRIFKNYFGVTPNQFKRNNS